ncbi:hypothetical protein KBY27_07000 [Ruegeria pomeroyi]|uniref:Uncharacterized protein n=1 Tax=Ruegeria pomeroyi TaxID=89184 RepID=A0A9Q3WJ03_9RHOB|nr:hypothetical protein [Ruegeria pomeroyi]MCE8537200.1 hypothetical protein [Ruegeria pomeroyi]
MRRSFLGLCLAVPLAACVQHEGTSGGDTARLIFFGGANTDRMNIVLPDFPTERCALRKPPPPPTDGDREAALLRTALLSIVTNVLTNAVVEGARKWAQRYQARYVGSANFSNFQIGRTTNDIRCVGIVRMGPLSTDKTRRDLYSAIVLELKEIGDGAMFVRPVYSYTPVLKAATSVKAEEIGWAGAAVTLSVAAVDADGELVSHSQSLGLKPARANVSSPFGGVRHRAVPEIYPDSPEGGYDTAIMPYHQGRPVTLSIAVTEVGAGANDAKALAGAVEANKGAISTLISGSLQRASN